MSMLSSSERFTSTSLWSNWTKFDIILINFVSLDTLEYYAFSSVISIDNNYWDFNQMIITWWYSYYVEKFNSWRLTVMKQLP